MKEFFLVLGVVFIAANTRAQSTHTSTVTISGESFSFKYFSPDYPLKAKEAGIQGEVTMMFDVDSTCTLINRRLTKGIGGGCDEAALKALDKTQLDLKKRYKSKCKIVNDIPYIVQFRMR